VAGWRGWVARGATAGPKVTSARLDSSAAPRSRLFPKTRSWFTLDSPLELLSPLSVLRVLFALAIVAWPVIGLASPVPAWGLVGIAAVTGSAAAVWVGLLLVKKVEHRSSWVLAAYWTAAVVLLVWCAAGTAAVGAFALFLVPGATFVALFLDGRSVVRQQLATVVALWAALAPAEGIGPALALALVAVVPLSAAPATILLLTRSARRAGVVDPDTGLPNGFGLARQLDAGSRTSFLVAVVALDGIDHAREALGYQVGTELLRRAVEDLGQVLPADALIGRVTGDELVVIMGLSGSHSSELSDGLPPPVAEAGRKLAESLVRAIAAGRYQVGTTQVPLRAHVGFCGAPWDATAVSELVRRASITAQRAADSGMAVEVWDGDRGAMTSADLDLLGDLALASKRGELTLAYQPQIASATGAVCSAEALLRWNSPVHGNVPPGRFITLAERTGAIDTLTEWVVGEALDAQVRWRHDGIEIPVSVNLSAKNLPASELAAWILAQVTDRHLPMSCLTVEVTETAVADPAQAAAVLQPLHRHGVRISIDDFGTGFTSLAQLPALPLDELKIDQCFVMRSATSSADEAIVHTIGELAHRLGLQVVAEGVETEETADRLRAVGIDILQGYHFARPMPESDFLEFVRRPRLTRTMPKMAVRAPTAVGEPSPLSGR
jgi:EAL domain-containing protein (putative c-di-GMP-specific phosphodiesterase class I)/GGDEF domain-containing protein